MFGIIRYSFYSLSIILIALSLIFNIQAYGSEIRPYSNVSRGVIDSDSRRVTSFKVTLNSDNSLFQIGGCCSKACTAGVHQSEISQDFLSGLAHITAEFGLLLQILTIALAAMSVLVAVFGLGIFSFLRRRVAESVKERMDSLIRGQISEAIAREIEYASRLSIHLENAKSEVTHNRLGVARRNLEEYLEELNSAGRLGGEGVAIHSLFLQEVAELVNIPSRVAEDVAVLVNSGSRELTLRERVRALWAEVKDNNISPRSMRRLIETVIEMLEHRDPTSAVLKPLREFNKQLVELIKDPDGSPLPAEPGF